MMSRDVNEFKAWFREDIRRILLGVNAASLSSGMHQHDGYRTGFVSALCSIALIIGIEPKSLMLPEDEDGQRQARQDSAYHSSS